MVIFDTNTILRYILQDIQDQADAFEQELSANECIITVEVIAEMVYVLSKVYNIKRELIAESIQGIIKLKERLVENSAIVSHAAGTYASTRLDFIDCLLDGYSKLKGYSVFTFDKDLKKQLSRPQA